MLPKEASAAAIATVLKDAAIKGRDNTAAPNDVLLGGGDAARWSHLPEILRHHKKQPAAERPRLWIEAPARSLSPNVLGVLHSNGVFGVLVQVEAFGEAMCKSLGVADGERVIHNAEAIGLQTQARIVIQNATRHIVVPLGKALFPRTTWVELSLGRKGSGVAANFVEKAMLSSPNLHFSAHRRSERGYLPPCVLPELWRERPTAFRTTLRNVGAGAPATTPNQSLRNVGAGAPATTPNQSFKECEECALKWKCQWSDVPNLLNERGGAVDSSRSIAIVPILDDVLPWERPRKTELPVPEAIIKKRPLPEVICITPWTTMEIVDPDGKVRQCCSTWTQGHRGNLHIDSLAEVWNGPGYQSARRIMTGADKRSLCYPICSRLHDEKFAEKHFRIQSGSEVFIKNQLLLADEIAERKEVLSANPLKIAICPSTYCNYDCIMCDHGRSPRRELPESIWAELERYLPTLSSLTLLGGEPLANPLAMKFLRAFDVTKTPDCSVDLVTNGSLLSEQTLKHLRRATLGDVTISLNAGTSEVYERVQRGIALGEVLKNIDRLIEFRRVHHRYFGITLSFVLQPAAAHTLIEFGEIARTRGLRIRLMALNPENHEGLDFYQDEAALQNVLEHTDKFLAYCEARRPEWVSEVGAARAAVVGEAKSRNVVRRLPIFQGDAA